ncbi:ABC transporter substrate-binding protein [Yersinia pseudotuberculosis]|uniref:ABC transporter substrate-binding protein n=1 Tax=Yersinia pseudotuberculosis TaxID=633 RepID=UPI0005AD5809|nr:sugar ABC transporter substrate-binding protein [Yersinia pseudotuberculosis]AJK16391.1 bacterial extracellular solute-binding family protein [Yersinia pseudotuberculosis str. PA3606]
MSIKKIGIAGIIGTLLMAGNASAQETLRVLLEGHSTSDSIKALLPEFEKQTGIKVQAEIVPYSDLTSKALLAFSSHSGRYDVVMDDWVHAVGYASAGYITPVDQWMESDTAFYDGADFVKSYADTLRYKYGYYGLPVYGESTFLMYRKDLFEQYGIAVPKTFDELTAAAKTIKEKTEGKVAGITLRGAQGIQNTFAWASFLWGYGGQWIDDNGKSAITSPQAVEATKSFVNILKNYGPIGAANFGWQENRLVFQQGKAAMTIDSTVNGGFNEDPKESTVVGKVGYAPVPVQPGDHPGNSGALQVHGLYISSDSKKQDAAWKFISWATDKQTQMKSVELNPNAGVSSLSAINSDAFTKRYGAFKDGMLAALQNGNAKYLPTIPQSTQIINITGIALSEALAGTQTVENALQQANTRNDKALSR